MRNVWTFTKQKETNMSQAPTVPSPVDAHKKQDAIEAMRSLSLRDQEDAVQQLGLTPPGKQVNDWIWLTIVVSFAIVLVGAFIALALAVFLIWKVVWRAPASCIRNFSRLPCRSLNTKPNSGKTSSALGAVLIVGR